MNITSNIKKILLSINGRSKKYTRFGFSRHEYEKYGMTEYELRKLIERLQTEQLIQKVETEKFIDKGRPRKRNIWIVTELFISLVASFKKGVENMNEKIISWCKNQNPIETMKAYGIEIFRGGRIGKKGSKITVNARNGAITNWKTGEKWNLFNYIRDTLGQGTYEFFTNNI